MPPKLLTISIILLAMITWPGKVFCGEKPKPTEYEVKAAYIYNFAKFVEWPSGTFRDGNMTIHVCVIGDDPFGSSLTLIDGKRAGDRKIVTRRNGSILNLNGCEILFIDGSEEKRLGHILNNIDGARILTVGDTEGFARKGVMINFFMDKDKIRFEINQKAAMRAGIRISSNLLRIARIVE